MQTSHINNEVIFQFIDIPIQENFSPIGGDLRVNLATYQSMLVTDEEPLLIVQHPETFSNYQSSD